MLRRRSQKNRSRPGPEGVQRHRGARIGIAAGLRNSLLRVRISPLSTRFPVVEIRAGQPSRRSHAVARAKRKLRRCAPPQSGETVAQSSSRSRRAANRGQRAGFLCDFFDDDRSSTDCPHAARSGARESAVQRERFSLAQLLTATARLFCRPLSGLASKLKPVSMLIGRHFREKLILRERRVPVPSVALVHRSHRQWQFSHSQSRSEAP